LKSKVVTRQRQVVAPAALCATVAIAGWVAGGPAGLDSRTIASTETPIEVIQIATAAVGAAPTVTPEATTVDRGSGSVTLSDPARDKAGDTTGSIGKPDKTNDVPLSDSRSTPEPAPVLLAATSPTDALHRADSPAANSKALDACVESDVCIDQYLWSLYERTPKVDTVKTEERIKAKVKIKGKMRTVVKTLIKYITEDFAWKDPKAAQKTGMSLKDYVIGGMDRDFKRKLYDALHAMEDAGFSPGITSAFRDDYRQELARGNKAAADSSYHGGSRRGGYGHGLAADLVSVKGETRAERCASSDILWKWIDAHEKEIGIGRPYLDRDPPHVAPVDGKEYADKRGLTKARLAGVKRSSLSSNLK